MQSSIGADEKYLSDAARKEVERRSLNVRTHFTEHGVLIVDDLALLVGVWHAVNRGHDDGECKHWPKFSTNHSALELENRQIRKETSSLVGSKDIIFFTKSKIQKKRKVI